MKILMQQIDIAFLGTASATPSPTRNHSSLALKLDNQVWLFDCGEGTQHQLIRSSVAKIGKINKVFITHLHGDHLYGLPGLLCTLSAAVAALESMTIELYGPPGLADYVHHCLETSVTLLSFEYKVFELWTTHPTQPTRAHILLPHANMEWLVYQDEQCKVYAGTLKHSIPCFGYVVQEAQTPGRLRMEQLQPLLKQYAPYLMEQGIKNPLSLLSGFKQGQPITLPDRVLVPSDFIDPPLPGRKIVILGDTCDASAMQQLCQGATVLVHEATNARLASDTMTDEALQEQTISHGHSTPQMAGFFAHQIQAKILILNHFSARYKGDTDPVSLAVMEEIRTLAVSTFKSDSVVCAKDLDIYNIPRHL